MTCLNNLFAVTYVLVLYIFNFITQDITIQRNANIDVPRVVFKPVIPVPETRVLGSAAHLFG